MSPTSRLAMILGILIAGKFESHADTLVVPNIYNNAQAVGPGSSVPFNRTDYRLQQIYLSPQFAAAAGDVISINEIRFRIDEDYAVGTVFSTVGRGVSIFMSTTTRNFDTATTTFSENIGIPLFQSLPMSNLPLNGVKTTSTSFDVVLPLPNAYQYDRTQGNLLVDIRVNQNSDLLFLDQQILLQDATFVIAGSGSSQTGTKGWQGLVTQFGYTVIPEPHSAQLFIVGVLMISTWFLKARRGQRPYLSHPSETSSAHSFQPLP